MLWFYGAFELLLMLMYAYLTQQAATARGTYAMYMLVVYTVLGSAMMATAFVLHYAVTGHTAAVYASSSPRALCHAALHALML